MFKTQCKDFFHDVSICSCQKAVGNDGNSSIVYSQVFNLMGMKFMFVSTTINSFLQEYIIVSIRLIICSNDRYICLIYF